MKRASCVQKRSVRAFRSLGAERAEEHKKTTRVVLVQLTPSLPKSREVNVHTVFSQKH